MKKILNSIKPLKVKINPVVPGSSCFAGIVDFFHSCDFCQHFLTVFLLDTLEIIFYGFLHELLYINFNPLLPITVFSFF